MRIAFIGLGNMGGGMAANQAKAGRQVAAFDLAAIQRTIRERFVQALASPQVSRPHIVVAHSMGTVIAYDCLKRVAACPEVDGLITLGSPLGDVDGQSGCDEVVTVLGSRTLGSGHHTRLPLP